MATLNDGGFWLPSKFLTDEDILMDKENFHKNGVNPNNNLCFPTEFPYEFGSFASSSFLSSPVDSVTESESDEEDFLTALTRHFARSTLQESHKIPSAPQNPEKTYVLSGSPQSTLSAVFSSGSPNGPSLGPSPPTTPLGGNDDAWDLIYAAAGQVNRLKMKNEGPTQRRGLLVPPRSLTSNPATGLYATHFQQVKQESGSIWGRQERDGWVNQQQVYETRGSRNSVGNGGFVESGRALGLPHSAWPPLQVQKQQYYQNQPQSGGGGMRAVFLGGGSGGGGGGVKRECAGTGVFLPRRFGTPSDSRRKPGCSTALLPPRVVQALNKNFDNMTTPAQPQPHFNGGGLVPNYDVLMAWRNALLAQQRRNSMQQAEGSMNHEIRLPQEWTY